MSIHTTTIYEFMQLTRPQLEHAVRLCDREISELQTFLAIRKEDDNLDDKYEEALNELASAITLRKVHKVRLDELVGEEPAPLLASQQYEHNELAAA